MPRRLHSRSSRAGSATLRHCLLAVAVLVLGAFARAQLSPSPSPPPRPAVNPPQRFERILWCSDPDAGPKLARSAGYTAVQLGRGGDAAALRSLGLRFYLDQPIGKGLLELRDAQWQPVVQAFERDRDAAALVRPSCFAEPDRVGHAAANAASEARRAGVEGMLFVALADEASSTRHNAPLDTCRCKHCLRDFGTFVRRRFPDIEALNDALGTHFASFDVAVPLSTDQIRRRELGEQQLPLDLRPFSLWLDFVDDQFAAAVRTIQRRVALAVPGVPVGLTGLSVPGPFGGHDYERLLRGHTLGEPYDIGGSIELARSVLSRSAHRYATLIPPAAESRAAKAPIDDYVRARLHAMASQGMAGVVVWNDGTIRAPARDGAEPVETPFGRAVRRSFAKHAAEFDALAGAVVEPGPVWVVESQPSVRAWWMIDSAADGLTWVRRLASYEQTHSTSQAARHGWIRLLQDIGLQPHFVSDRNLATRLLTERPRFVVLPATLALSDRTIQALEVYVRNGGHLLADHSTALYDQHLKRRERGGLDGLFGIEQRSLQWSDLLVREGRSTARERGLPPAERLLRGELAEQARGADTFLERSVGRGRAYYLNAPVVAYPGWRLDAGLVGPARELRRRVRAALQRARVVPPCEVQGKGLPTCIERVPLRLRDGRRVVAIRINALERPSVLRQIASNGPVEIELIWPRTLRLRELRGREHGAVSRCKTTLDPWGAVYVEVGR